MRAGYADLDITPPPGEEMTGYGYYLNRRARGTLDSLMARALAIGEDQARAVIVQLDLLGLSKSFTADVREEAQRRFGLEGTRLMLHCTHTHSGPGTMPLYGCGMPSEHFLMTLREQILSVVGAALEDLQAVARARRFEGDFAEGFAHNRVGGADLDTQVRGLWIELEGARPILVISYACHPVTLGRNDEYSADYCGAVIREFNAYGIRAVYLNGCSGDINPLSNAYRFGSGKAATLHIYGRDLAAAVRRAMAEMRDIELGPVRAASKAVAVEAAMPTEGELQDALQEHRLALRDNPADGQRRVQVAWHEVMLAHHQMGTLEEARRAEIQVIGWGEAAFVGLAAETFTRLGWIIRESAPDHHMLIGATSNGVIGYIATREDVEAGGYASAAAPILYGMPIPSAGAGERWAAEGGELVAEAV